MIVPGALFGSLGGSLDVCELRCLHGGQTIETGGYVSDIARSVDQQRRDSVNQGIVSVLSLGGCDE